jgi:type II secretory pathway pseudopilin PulG
MALTSSARPLPRRLRRGEDGYILLTLLLVVALMTIAATVVISEISFEIKRDREQEMIHRGVQYTRAIRAYYKKLGRYPTKLEDLDNTNNLRYLRKHYKDPENKNKDFKLLHFGDPGLSLSGGFGGGMIPGASPAGSPGGLNGPGSSNSAFGGGSSFGGSSFGGSGSGAGFGGSGVNSQGVFAQSGPGGNSSGGFGGTNNSEPSNTPGANQTNGGDPSQAGSSGSQDSSSPQSRSTSSNGQGGQVFGGGAIVGVASLCKDKTIRIFNKKSKYNEWQFVYDPTADRGGLITTPYQPLQNLGSGGIPGAQPAGGTGTGSAFGNSGSAFGNNGSSFGNSGSSFGSSSGFGNSPGQNGPASPVQTPSNPPQ